MNRNYKSSTINEESQEGKMRLDISPIVKPKNRKNENNQITLIKDSKGPQTWLAVKTAKKCTIWCT